MSMHNGDRKGSQHTSAYVSIRQHTSAYVSKALLLANSTASSTCIRQHTSAYVSKALLLANSTICICIPEIEKAVRNALRYTSQ